MPFYNYHTTSNTPYPYSEDKDCHYSCHIFGGLSSGRGSKGLKSHTSLQVYYYPFWICGHSIQLLFLTYCTTCLVIIVAVWVLLKAARKSSVEFRPAEMKYLPRLSCLNSNLMPSRFAYYLREREYLVIYSILTVFNFTFGNEISLLYWRCCYDYDLFYWASDHISYWQARIGHLAILANARRARVGRNLWAAII